MKKISGILLLFLSGLIMISCKPTTESADYMGQTYPDSTPVIFAPGIISKKGRLEHGISFTPDTRELAFGILNNDDFSGELFYAKKVAKHWTDPMAFEPLKNKSTYLPYFSPNGKSLLYAQSTSDTDKTATDIWIMEKINDAWSSSKKIQGPVNSVSREANAGMTLDGTIYFSSNRNCEGKENCYAADLFNSKLIGNEYQKVNIIPEFISPYDNESVFISPKEDYIIFCRYTDNETGMDLYISYRDIHKKWSEPKVVDSTINSKYWDRRPFVSIDNNFLFYTQLQIEGQELIESDIFWVDTSKLFKPFIYHPLSDTIVQVGEKFEISIPTDYFKDIDGQPLTLKMNPTELDWLTFNSKNRILSGVPTQEGDFELTFTAVDTFSNMTEETVTIIVKK